MNKWPSVYKEVGINAGYVRRPPRRKKRDADFGLFSDGQHRARSKMHSWDLIKTKEGRQVDRAQTCMRCGHPRFVVEGKPCSGKRA